MLHPHISVRTSPISGLGTFALQTIPADAVVWRRDPDEETFSRSEIDAWAEADRTRFWRLAYQVEDHRWSGPAPDSIPDPADYMNHSCDPNTGFLGDGRLVSLRTIREGEEVTYDYRMSETGAFEMPCRCGAGTCLGLVTGTQLLEDPLLAAHYQGKVMRHVQAFLRGV